MARSEGAYPTRMKVSSTASGGLDASYSSVDTRSMHVRMALRNRKEVRPEGGGGGQVRAVTSTSAYRCDGFDGFQVFSRGRRRLEIAQTSFADNSIVELRRPQVAG